MHGFYMISQAGRQLLRSVCPSCLQLQRLASSTGIWSCKLGDNAAPAKKKYTPRRAVLYVPGNDERKLQKIPTLKVDCAVMDCEDGVAANRKEEARETIKHTLDHLDFDTTECAVRVNSVSSGLMDVDLTTVFEAATLPQTLMFPKVNSVQELIMITHTVQSMLKQRELKNKISLVLFVESALGLLNLQDVCAKGTELSLKSSTFNVDGLVFGSDDYCADIGAKRSVEGWELMYARQKFVTVAKAFRLQAIDMVHIDYKDETALWEQSVKGACMGFTGKQVIHPSQIPIVHDAFSPGPDQVEWATELIKAFDEHQASGKGAFTFRGKMIDMPSLLQAKNIVQLSDTIKSL